MARGPNGWGGGLGILNTLVCLVHQVNLGSGLGNPGLHEGGVESLGDAADDGGDALCGDVLGGEEGGGAVGLGQVRQSFDVEDQLLVLLLLLDPIVPLDLASELVSSVLLGLQLLFLLLLQGSLPVTDRLEELIGLSLVGDALFFPLSPCHKPWCRPLKVGGIEGATIGVEGRDGLVLSLVHGKSEGFRPWAR